MRETAGSPAVDRSRRARTAALALAVTLAAGGSMAASAPSAAAADPDAGVAQQCRAPIEAYRTLLHGTNPPEVVEISIANLMATLHDAAEWSPAQLAERQALNRHARETMAPGDPAAVEAAVIACAIGAEVERRRTGDQRSRP